VAAHADPVADPVACRCAGILAQRHVLHIEADARAGQSGYDKVMFRYHCTVPCIRSTTAAFCILAIFALSSTPALAEVRYEDLGALSVRSDFVVGPGKVELTMQPGEERVVELRVTNRFGIDRLFRVGFEDFTGSSDPNQAVILLGSERGPYSLRQFVFPATNELIVEHGSRAVIPVRIVIPEDAEPGGLYGSVLISTETLPDPNDPAVGARPGSAVISRIGVLFFVRVAGAVHEEGQVASFATAENKRWYAQGPIPLEIHYENTGSVHLNPYGRISITNIAGQMIGEQEIDPWFVMPDTTRIRGIEWDRPLLFGRYTAHLEMNRGYRDIVDERTFVFWVIPLKLVGLLLLGLFVLFFIMRFFVTRLEIRVK
jgi:hypothetical protein